jgi:hypothetical protein
MATDFEKQVPAQESQGSSKDEQAREHTNGYDKADAGTAGAATGEIEISIFEKPGADGPLTKVGRLGPDGKPEMDPSYCWMSSGTVRVASFTTMTACAALIGGLSPQQAISIGVPKRLFDTKKAIPNLSRQERIRLDIMIAAQKTALARPPAFAAQLTRRSRNIWSRRRA